MIQLGVVGWPVEVKSVGGGAVLGASGSSLVVGGLGKGGEWSDGVGKLGGAWGFGRRRERGGGPVGLGLRGGRNFLHGKTNIFLSEQLLVGRRIPIPRSRIGWLRSLDPFRTPF